MPVGRRRSSATLSFCGTPRKPWQGHDSLRLRTTATQEIVLPVFGCGLRLRFPPRNGSAISRGTYLRREPEQTRRAVTASSLVHATWVFGVEYIIRRLPHQPLVRARLFLEQAQSALLWAELQRFLLLTHIQHLETSHIRMGNTATTSRLLTSAAVQWYVISCGKS